MEIKGVVHVHSTYSYDGKESLVSLKEFFLKHGISFCCVTEHTDKLTVEEAHMFIQECKALSGSQFVFIPGFEVPYKNAHVLLIGTEMFLGQTADAQTLTQWSSKAALTVLAHPVRNKFIVDDTLRSVMSGLEIWNQQYEGKRVPRSRSVRLFQKLQETNPQLMATGGLDFHRKEHFGAPVYTLELQSLLVSSIIEALQKGTYTFGSKKVQVSPSGNWKGNNSLSHKFQSLFSIGVIGAGKKVNALLAHYNLTLPKSLKQIIRSRI
jgi:predicted metal-dependent phosphoesterase TrpH